MKTCGLLGETLSHSFSPQIHSFFGDYAYHLFEKAPQAIEAFLKSDAFDGINVTIPYKKTVVPFCKTLSPIAKRLKSVNTLVKMEDGSLFGHNTDYFGLSYMLKKSGLLPQGKKALVLGSGGAAVTAMAVLSDAGAKPFVISRSGPDNYDNLEKHADAEIIVNTTPVGMYPNAGASPVSLGDFPKCRIALDLIYNPEKTALLLEAEARGIPYLNGLPMLVAQAKESAEYFTGRPIPDEEIDDVCAAIRRTARNIVLIGMPGCGKTTLGQKMAQKMGRRFVDADAEIVQEAGCTIPEIFASEGEAGFRVRETAVLRRLGKSSGLVIATGGGCVTREENLPLLRQNGTVFWIKREISQLAREGRPLSAGADLEAMYQLRAPLYARFADFEVENTSPEDGIERMLKLYENSCN